MLYFLPMSGSIFSSRTYGFQKLFYPKSATAASTDKGLDLLYFIYDEIKLGVQII